MRWQYTDSAGGYAFLNLEPDTYAVGFDLPASEYHFTRHRTDFPATNSDVVAKSGGYKTDPIEFNSGETVENVDAGMYTYGKLGNFVWEDRNGNGVQDTGEPGIGNVTVTIESMDGYGSPPQSTQTDQYGKYLFENFIPGDYRVEFTRPSTGTWYFTKQVSGQGALDSDVVRGSSKTNPMTGTVKVQSGKTNADVDAGLFHPATVTGRVWVDTDGNGKQGGSNEPGLAGAVVRLYRGTTQVQLVNPTPGDGTYSFGDLDPGGTTTRWLSPCPGGRRTRTPTPSRSSPPPTPTATST